MHNFKEGDRVYIPKQYIECRHAGCHGIVIRGTFSDTCKNPYVDWNDGPFNSRTQVNPIHLRKEDSQLLFNFMYE